MALNLAPQGGSKSSRREAAAKAVRRLPDTKSGDPVTIHLAKPALEILARRVLNADGCPWVFPGGKKNRAGHLVDPKGAWTRLLTASGLKDLRMHDLRRSLGSWQAAGGASLQVIGKSLGHKSQQSTAVYARLNLDPVRTSVNGAVEAMLAAGNKEGMSNG
jgi:integrase